MKCILSVRVAKSICIEPFTLSVTDFISSTHINARTYDFYKSKKIRFRPHMKTHKTLEIGEMMTGGTKREIVVSTLNEVCNVQKATTSNLFQCLSLHYVFFKNVSV